MTNDLGNLGIAIRRLRTDKGLTQEGFAAKLGITPQAVSKWETGLGYPDITMLPAIADALGVSIEELFGREPKVIIKEAPRQEEPAPQNNNARQGEDYVLPKSSFESFMDGLPLVYVSDGRAVYSDLKPTSRKNNRVDFEDGSFVDLNTNTTTNFNHGRISIAYEEIPRQPRRWFASRREEDRSYNGGAIDSLDIKLGGQCDIVVHKGEEGQWRMNVHASQDFFELFDCSEQSGKLTLTNSARKAGFSGFGNFGNFGEVEIELWCGFTKGESLDLKIMGSGDAKIEPDFEESTVKISGSGDVIMADAGTCDCGISGSGDIKLEFAHDFNAKISGSGSVTAERIDGVSKIQISGSGDLDVRHLAGSFDAAVGGSGDITVGDGNLDGLNIRFSGSGSFEGRGVTVTDAEITLRGASDATIGRVTGRSVEHIDRTSELKIIQRG